MRPDQEISELILCPR